MSNKLTLTVMAAGMGSRFGGLKQIEPVGPHGEVILEYSVYDALEAGFDKAVFIIKKEIEKDFRARLLPLSAMVRRRTLLTAVKAVSALAQKPAQSKKKMYSIQLDGSTDQTTP